MSKPKFDEDDVRAAVWMVIFLWVIALIALSIGMGYLFGAGVGWITVSLGCCVIGSGIIWVFNKDKEHASSD